MAANNLASSFAEISALAASCRVELARLHKVSAEWRVANSGLWHELPASYKTEIRTEPPKAVRVSAWIAPQVYRPGLGLWRERAQETRSFASEVRDPVTRRHLLDMAENYDLMAAGADARPRKA